MMWGKTMFLPALVVVAVVVVVVLRESRDEILIMRQLFNSETEPRNPKMEAVSPLGRLVCVTDRIKRVAVFAECCSSFVDQTWQSRGRSGEPFQGSGVTSKRLGSSGAALDHPSGARPPF